MRPEGVGDYPYAGIITPSAPPDSISPWLRAKLLTAGLSHPSSQRVSAPRAAARRRS